MPCPGILFRPDVVGTIMCHSFLLEPRQLGVFLAFALDFSKVGGITRAVASFTGISGVRRGWTIRSGQLTRENADGWFFFDVGNLKTRNRQGVPAFFGRKKASLDRNGSLSTWTFRWWGRSW